KFIDCVFLPTVDIPLRINTVESRQALWVALTRARKFVHVSLGKVETVFSADAFIPFDVGREPADELVCVPIDSEQLTSNDWFRLSGWAKTHNKLSGWERKFCYSQGVRKKFKRKPSEKELEKANEILAAANIHLM
ncbi:MAG: hypothetical protein ABGW78_00425, partial [Pirellulales bacterium]